jgi:3-hydroxyisobutyrate dehydrogenase-like beta-hydroxyacid dehydrogenase
MAASLDETGPVALVGLGNMGTAVGERLLDAGAELFVYNRSAGRDEALVARGAARLTSAGDALQAADVCILTLADDAAVEALALGGDGVLAGARPSTALIEMSTISVAASRRVGEAAVDRSVGYLRAPFSGNPTAIRGGKAVIFVSGPTDVAARCYPILRAITPTVHNVGEGEQARVLKLALQILIAGTTELLSEAVVLGEAAGLDRKALLDVVNQSVVGSPFVEYKSEPLLRDDFTATFTTAMMMKDVDLVLDLARSVDVELPVTEELRSLLDAACEGGHADQDFMALVLELKERSGARTPTRNR